MASGEERYQEFAPPPVLRPFVRVIWTYAAPAPTPVVQRIAPDGWPELVFDIGAPYEEQGHDGEWRLQPSALFAGQMTRPLALRPVGATELVAIRFEPDGARDWLGLPLNEATDRRLDMPGVCAASARLRVIRRDKRRCLRTGSRPSAAPPTGASTRSSAPRSRRWPRSGQVRTERPLNNAPAAPLRDRVGVSPRLLRSIFRFRRVFDHAADPARAEGWLGAGLEVGYFDQPQMARDFRRFLGCTATDWAREQHDLARAIASQSYKPDAPPGIASPTDRGKPDYADRADDDRRPARRVASRPELDVRLLAVLRGRA